MIIKKVNIFGFGKWVDTSFDTADDFHIFYGLNEAGKTTLRAFIRGVLFGFGKKTDTDKYKPRFGSSFGGELLVSQNGVDYLIRRVGGLRSRSGSVIVTSEGKEYDESKLHELLGAADLSLYENIFEFDENALNEVFRLKKDDFTDQILHIGMTGSQDWLNLSNSLASDAGTIFKPSGTKPLLNLAMKEHRDLEKKVSEAGQENNIFNELQQQNKELSQNKEQIHQQIEKKNNTIKKLQQLNDNWHNYDEYLTLLNSISNRRNLDVDLYDDFMKQKKDFETAKEDLKIAREEVDKITESTITNNPRYAFYLDNKEEFDDLESKLSEVTSVCEKNEKISDQIAELTKDQNDLLVKNAFKMETEEMSKEDYLHGLELKRNYDELEDVRASIQGRTTIDSPKSTKAAARNRSKKNWAPTIICLLIGLVVGAVGMMMGSIGHIVSIAGVIIGVLAAIISYVVSSPVNTREPDESAVVDDKTRIEDELKHVNLRMQDLVRELTNLKDKYRYEYPIDTFLGFQLDLKKLHENAEKKKKLEEDQDKYWEQVNDYFSEFDFAKNWIQIQLKDQVATLNLISSFFEDMANISTVNAQNEEKKKFYVTKINKLNFEMDDANKEMARLLRDNGLQSEMELEVYHHDLLNRERQREQLKIYESNLSSLLPELKKFDNYEQLKWSLDQNSKDVKELTEQEREIGKEILSNQSQLQGVINTEKYDQLRQDLANLESRIESLTKSWITNYLGSNWIKAALDDATQERFPQIIDHASEYFNVLTDNRYRGINFEGDTINVERLDSQTFEIAELSQGTAEQLYVALRFAFAISFLDKIQLPLIIDDAFINFDVVRRAKVIELIQKLAVSTQLLFFTTDLGIRNQFVSSNHLTELIV
ncbi:ATP-binding protein [Xylocopilactobacillus apicola]|uniref:YhaN AAA domain-containing protein n=1 Tax=Xylocopilactobacillus apicola TaxID=2932184 RepID=A0AAU9DRD6_9LACO|nr:AAA family ATPase [Xylocopilactobacillus apicola]BDR58504.1 hypothetical protein XA3_09450 [Xylocopilactobacillus apicola]